MPKKEITDYVIYKIICNDENIKDCYVGSTSNFKVRKCDHAKNCNGNIVNYKIYQIIRENGGWTNWSMLPIAEYKELTFIQARIKEEECRVNLNAQLNSRSAYRTGQESKQELYKVQIKNYYEIHKEEKKEKCKNYYQENKEKRNQYLKQWRKNNPEKTKETNRKHNQSEERKAYMKEYNKQYREKLKQKQEIK